MFEDRCPPSGSYMVFELGAWRTSSYTGDIERGAPAWAAEDLHRGWQAYGWDAAFHLIRDAQFAHVNTRESIAPSVHVSPENDGRIVEHYPPRPGDAHINHRTLFAAIASAQLRFRCNGVELVVVVLDVPDAVAGWYSASGEVLKFVDVLEARSLLAETIPVAFGRAGFKVDVVVIVTISPQLKNGMETMYLDQLWMAGVLTGELEGVGSDKGWTTRGNYAVSDRLLSNIPGRHGGAAVAAVSWAVT